MSDDFELDVDEGHDAGALPDATLIQAVFVVQRLFKENPDQVFFTRQIEIRFEDQFYHWITNRAVHLLHDQQLVKRLPEKLNTGTPITLWWNKKARYVKRPIKAVLDLVNEYSDPEVGEYLGLHGQDMMLAAFARSGFNIVSENVNNFDDNKWSRTNHDLDLIVERDGRNYGVEIKNTLGYMRYEELKLKTEMALYLGLIPMFVVRHLPRSWIWETKNIGGFVLLLKYQLYPISKRDLARRIKETFGLPVDAPKRLFDTTMERVLNWHNQQLMRSVDPHPR